MPRLLISMEYLMVRSQYEAYIDPILICGLFSWCYSLVPPGTPMLGSQHREFPTKVLEDMLVSKARNCNPNMPKGVSLEKGQKMSPYSKLQPETHYCLLAK